MGQKTFSAEVKSRAALEAIKGGHTLSEISSKYGVHSSAACRRKKEALEAVKSGFMNKNVIIRHLDTRLLQRFIS